MLDKIEQYLQQQQEAYGSTLFFSSDSPTNGTAVIPEDSAALSASDMLMSAPEATGEISIIEQNNPVQTKNTMADIDRIFHPPKVEAKDIFTPLPAWTESQTLPVLYEHICGCMNCSLGESRNKFVFGVGNPQADIVVIGEAPGADEDAQGEPFVGRAGQLLTKILEAINLKRDDVYICNILKCRPPGNRRPLPTEVEECEPYLYKQLDIIQPKFILALGLTAIETLLKDKFKMGETRGKWLNYYGARLIVTYHPAALLRNPEWKKLTWEDVKQLRAAYDAFIATGALPDVV